MGRIVGTAALLLVMNLGVTASSAQDARASAAPEPWYPGTNDNGDPVLAVFQSRIPGLDEQARATRGCERVKFALVLYHDAQTRAPTTYLMARVYVGDGSGRIVDGGSWAIGSGTEGNPGARVYQLDANAPPDFRSFWAISDDVIFLLDQNRRPRVGDAGYGYALNRTD